MLGKQILLMDTSNYRKKEGRKEGRKEGGREGEREKERKRGGREERVKKKPELQPNTRMTQRNNFISTPK